MKKFTHLFFCLLLISSVKHKAQVTFYVEAPVFDNSTSTGRGPNGSANHVYMRGCGLVKATELTAIAPNTTLTSFGFTLNAGASTNAPVGNFTVYLQNTADATYNKGTNWATAITGMTQVYANTMTIPLSAGSTSVILTLSTPFVYTGGGIYVAYDWYCPGPYSTTNAVYRCNSGGLSPGFASNASTTSAPTTLGTTAFRPCFIWGYPNTYTNEISVSGLEAPGRVAGILGTSQTVTAFVRNNSNMTRTNIPVTLNVTGANTFANTQTITSLAAGASTTVSFSVFTPMTAGLNTLAVSVPADENNANNTTTFTQSVTCNEWAINPAAVSYTMGSVGFNTASGVIAATYSNTVGATLTGLRGAVSTNTPSIGNQTWGVLLSSTGSVLATTNSVTISNVMMGTMQNYSFTPSYSLTPNTTYYFGFAQPTGTVGYFPMGTYTSAYVPFTKYVTTTTVGGVPAPLTSNLGYFGIEAIFEPTLALPVSSSTVNCGTMAVLSTSTTASYTWAGGPSNSSYSVTPLVTTNYTINAINGFACSGSNTVYVVVNPIVVVANSSSPAICEGNTVSVTAGGATNYTWSSGPATTSATFTDAPLSTTIYSVLGANTNGCANGATVMVTVNSNPTISATSQTVTCGDQVTLTATSSDSYTWTSGPVNSNYIVTPTLNTVYGVTTENSFACTATATLSVFVNSIVVTASSSSGTICAGTTVTITGSGASSYTWNAGPNPNGSSFTDSPTVTTIYHVTGDNPAGCSDTSLVTVVVNSFNNLGVSSTSLSACQGQGVSATGSGAGTYTWNTGAVTYTTAQLTHTPSAAGTYTLSGTDTNGCSASLTVAVAVHPNPTILASAGNPTMCIGESNTLTATGAVNYNWSNSQAGPTITVTPVSATTVVYTVTGTDANSCSNTATVSLLVNECTAISENGSQPNGVRVYPNPSAGLFHVTFETTSINTEIKVLNSLGGIVASLKETKGQNLIDLNDQPNGLYFITIIENGKLVYTTRVIKQ